MGRGCAALMISSREDQEYVRIECDLVQIYILSFIHFLKQLQYFFSVSKQSKQWKELHQDLLYSSFL